MIKVLEQAIEKVKALSPERQHDVAQVIEQMAEAGEAGHRLSDEERRLIEEGIAAAERGEFASEADVRALLNRYRT